MDQSFGEVQDAAGWCRQLDYRKTIFEFSVGSLAHVGPIENRRPSVTWMHIAEVGDVIQEAVVVQGGIQVVGMSAPLRPQAPMPAPAILIAQRACLEHAVGMRL